MEKGVTGFADTVVLEKAVEPANEDSHMLAVLVQVFPCDESLYDATKSEFHPFP